MQVQFTGCRMPRNKFARICLMAGLLAAVANTPVLAADAAAAKNRAVQCFVCHGADGMAKVPDAPNLAGQNPTYLVKALKDYRAGRREHEVMSMMAKSLSDEDMALVAAYFGNIAISVKTP